LCFRADAIIKIDSMRLFTNIVFLLLTISFQSFAQTKDEQDVAYTKTITQRAEKIVEPLGIANQEVAVKVRDIIVQQYRSLNEIHTTKDNKLKSAKELKTSNKELAEEMSKNAENKANAGLYNLHFDYLSKLMFYLDEAQVEKVKDGMTYGVLPITYKGYCDMVLGLTDEQKRQVKVWLIEAREHAMDAGTSDEKHKWFGKYKGRINNYLSASGYDMKKEGEEWQKRIKESENKTSK
jgi:hypothetical protein